MAQIFFFFTSLLALLSGCGKRPESPESSSREPHTQNRSSERPRHEGNGEAYNGPAFTGTSVPPFVDPGYRIPKLANSVQLCYAFEFESWLRQIFGANHFTTLEESRLAPVVIGNKLAFSVDFRQRIEVPSSPGQVMVFDGLFSVKPEAKAQSSATFTITGRQRNLVPGTSRRTLSLTMPGAMPIVFLEIGYRRSPAPTLQETRLLLDHTLQFRGFTPEEIVIDGISLGHLRDRVGTQFREKGSGRPVAITANPQAIAECLQSNRSGVEIALELHRPQEMIVSERTPSENEFTRFFLSRLREIQSRPAIAGDWRNNARQEVERWLALRGAAEKFIRNYFSGNLTLKVHNGWVAWNEEDLKAWHGSSFSGRTSLQFLSLVDRNVNEMANETLRRGKGPTLRALAAALEDRPAGGRRCRSSYRDTPSNGFWRSDRTAFVSWPEEHPDTFVLNYVHEMAHLLDSRLSESEAYFRARIFESARNGAWVKEVRDKRKFLLAGLDRGLLAEWRAWTVSLAAYREGIREGLWRPQPDWEEALAGWDGKDLPAHVLRYLDSGDRFLDPEPAGLFRHPGLVAELREIRRELRSGELKPELGTLKTLLSY